MVAEALGLLFPYEKKGWRSGVLLMPAVSADE